MNKNILRIVFALAGFFTLNLHAEMVWTTGSCLPTEWQPLGDNILLGKNKFSSNAQGVKDYASLEFGVLTDGCVPITTPDKESIFGFRNNENICWMFDVPMSIEQIRISSCYLGGVAYDGVHIAKMEVMYFGSDEWVQIAGDSEYKGESSQGRINYTVLSNGDVLVAQNIIGLKITFGTCENGYANYYTEIEAVGFAEARGPVLGETNIAQGKTKAKVTGEILDVGEGATECNVYLSLNGANPVRIAKRVTDSFEYNLEGLTAGTTYSYTLSISNNAPTIKGLERRGQFTTLALDDRTMMWVKREGVPDDFKPIENNVLSKMIGKTTGTISGYGGGVELLTNGEVSGETKQTCGFYEGATVEWLFDVPKTLKSIVFTTCYTADWGVYDDIKISKIEVKTLGVDSWEVLDVDPVDYAGSGNKGTALFATLRDVENGYIVSKATALRITFAKPNNVAQYYAEIEASEYIPERKTGFTIFIR